MGVSRFWVCTTCSEAVVVAMRQVHDHTEPLHLAQCPSCHWEVHLFLAAWSQQIIAFPHRTEDSWAAEEQSQQAFLVSDPSERPRRRRSRKKVR